MNFQVRIAYFGASGSLATFVQMTAKFVFDFSENDSCTVKKKNYFFDGGEVEIQGAGFLDTSLLGFSFPVLRKVLA